MDRKLVSFDWAMKKILRQKANFGILEGFLTELLKFDVKIEEILESEANQETEDDKFNRVDLLAKNKNNELILIEVQHSNEIDYFHRMLFGVSKLITEYIKKGKGYAKVKKVYSVNIVYFALGQGGDYVYYGKTIFRGLHNNKDILKPSQRQKEDFNIEEISDIYPEYYSYFKETSFTWDRTGGDPITQGNRNPLLYKNIGADGIKTGSLTVEQYSLASSIKVGERRITAVASGFKTKNSRSRESLKMLNWGLKKFDTILDLRFLKKFQMQNI